MKKLIFSAVLLLIFSMLLVGCVPQEEPAPEEDAPRGYGDEE
jgi:hypothetical protein